MLAWRILYETSGSRSTTWSRDTEGRDRSDDEGEVGRIELDITDMYLGKSSFDPFASTVAM